MPLDRFCNFLWWVMIRNLESEADLAALKAKLWRPPPKVEAPADSPWSADAEMAAFQSLKNALGQ